MGGRTRARRAIVEFAEVATRLAGKFLECVGATSSAGDGNQGRFGHRGNRFKLRRRVKTKILEQILIDGEVRSRRKQQGVPVGSCADHVRSPDIARSPGFVVNDKRLAQTGLERWRQQSQNNVTYATRCIR